MLQSCGTREGYTLIGEVADADGLVVTLMKVTPDFGPVEINSTVVRRGKFKLRGSVLFPEYCVLYIGDNGPLQFFVENTTLQLDIDIENIQESQVTGSRENDLLIQFYGIMSLFDEKANEIQNQYMTMMLSGELSEDSETDFAEQMETIRLEIVDFMRIFSHENYNSILVALIIESYLSPHVQPEELEKFLLEFDEVNSQSPWVQMIVNNIENAKRFAVGQPFIDLKMSTPTGEQISISDFAGKGSYLLLDFWASWCQPCRLKNPNLVELYNKFKDKGFEIIGISLDADKDEWIKAIEDDGLSWNHISDLAFWQSEAAKSYSITQIPQTILLDKEGNILARGLSINELGEKLAELLEN